MNHRYNRDESAAYEHSLRTKSMNALSPTILAQNTLNTTFCYTVLMDIYTTVGIVGATIILITFLLNQSGKLSTESRVYDALNALGSCILVVYAVLLESVPFMILNTVWFAVSFRDVVRSFNT